MLKELRTEFQWCSGMIRGFLIGIFEGTSPRTLPPRRRLSVQDSWTNIRDQHLARRMKYSRTGLSIYETISFQMLILDNTTPFFTFFQDSRKPNEIEELLSVNI